MKKAPIVRKTIWGKFLKWGIVAEIFGVGCAYLIYNRLNTKQDFRYQCHKNYPYILELYYQAGEKLGSLETRKTDLEAWKFKVREIKE